MKKYFLLFTLTQSFLLKADQVFNYLLNNNFSAIQESKKTDFDTPTDAHIFQHYKIINQNLRHAIKNGSSLLTAIHQKEVEENLKGRYTFVHAQQWFWEWYEELYKMLYEIKHKTTISNFYFSRFFNPDKIDLQKEEEIYQDILKQGRIDHWKKGKSLRPRLLFLNAPLFGNTQNLVCCSVDFWQNGSDWSWLHPHGISNETLFKKFSLQSLYKKYKIALQKLEQEHKALTSHGHILFFSMTKQFVTDNVYMARMCGYKNNVNINGQSTNNVCTFIDKFKQNPLQMGETDVIEFCLILTKHRSLQPTPACQIFAFNDVDAQKWKEFSQKREALFTQIRKDITG